MKLNVYLVVFGIIIALVVLAGLSTFVFNQNLSAQNVSLSSLKDYGLAPSLQGGSAWINSQPINITQLRGKVVLVDFWTYSCINCIRSIPYLNAWYKKYGNDGLVIIGVHTPEFQFEHNYSNVLAAVKKFGIEYPVVLDNNYSIWNAYANEYWPADYLIDKNGDIRYVAIGEGDYNTTETVIRELLENAGQTLPSNLTNTTPDVNFSDIGTPEIYLGWAKAREYLGNSQGFSPNMTVDYTLTNITQPNTPYLLGSWYNAPQSMVAVNNSKLFLVYRANKVNIVAGGNATIIVKLDGKNLNQSDFGRDDVLSNGEAVVRINSSRLYNIVSSNTSGIHLVEIDASPGFNIYTFTFG
jgi:thiol-disulfide isomerase/thioredoxin